MRIAVLSPVWFPVPPDGYGGIEWIVSLLADGLVDEGHDVTLFASGDSRTRARLEAVFDVAPSEWIGHTFWELRHAVSCLSRAAEYDVISDHTGLLGLALGSMGETPVRPHGAWAFVGRAGCSVRAGGGHGTARSARLGL